MTCCTLGARPDIETITRAMLPADQGGEGLTVRAVAERFGETKFKVERHWQCLRAKGHKPSPAPLPPRRDGKPQSERRPTTGQPDTGHRTEPDSDQTAQKTPDKKPDTGQDQTPPDARQTGLSASWRERIWFIADLIADDKYEGRKTNGLLAQQFGVPRERILDDVRVASLLVSKDRGAIETRREVSLAKLETIRQQAMEKTRVFTCPSCKAEANVACPDLKAAVTAQRHMDEISGVLVKQPPSVQITVNPAFAQLWGAMSKMLEDKHPAAYDDCERLIARFDAALRKRETIDVAVELPMLEAG